MEFPTLFKSAVKIRGSHLRNGSYHNLTLKIDLKVKTVGTVKCPQMSNECITLEGNYVE